MKSIWWQYQTEWILFQFFSLFCVTKRVHFYDEENYYIIFNIIIKNLYHSVA